MSDLPRPRRSVLYMPGANERALEKAKTLPADALIFDLEDAVAPDAKAAARDRVCEAVGTGAYAKREVTIRVNGADTEWYAADVAAAAAAGPAGVVVPKVDSAAEVHDIERALEAGGAPDHTRIWAMLETPLAVANAIDIATCSERLGVLVMGTNDLVKELQAEHVAGREPLVYALSACVAAARIGGKAILDGVFNDISDIEAFKVECAQGRQMGFDGKTLIHPKQLEPCNHVFAPNAAEIERSERIIEAFEAARAQGRGVVTVDGRMVENMHVDNARRILALTEAIAELKG